MLAAASLKLLGPFGNVRRHPVEPKSIVPSPIRNMDAHQSLEDLPVVGDAQMQQFVGNHEVLETHLLIGQILGKRDDATGRA